MLKKNKKISGHRGNTINTNTFNVRTNFEAILRITKSDLKCIFFSREFTGFTLIITTMRLKQQFWHSYHILLKHKLRPIQNNRTRQQKRRIEYIHLFIEGSNGYKTKKIFYTKKEIGQNKFV
jgi:hypothetical protein